MIKTARFYRPLSLFLAMRYVRSRQGNGFSSFISASSTMGIGLGVMVLIIVLSAMNGFERELSQRLLSIVPHAELIGVNEPLPDWRKSIKLLQNTPDVIAAAPVIKMSGMMQKGSQLKAIGELRGVDVLLETQVSSISDFIIEGNWQALTQENTVVIGAGIAKKLLLKIGDKVQMFLPRTDGLLSKGGQQQSGQAQSKGQRQSIQQQIRAPMIRSMKVVGIFKFGGLIDDTLAYMSIEQAANFINYNELQAQGVRLKVKDVFSASKIARDVAYTWDHYVYILDWTRTQGPIYHDIQLVRMVMFIVMALVIAVASFNIVSTLIMAVNDKKSDIAILKTMGASRSLVMVTFMIQGLVNGVIGCAVGALLGIYISLNLTEIVLAMESFFGTSVLSGDVYFIDFIPTYLHQPDVVVTVTTALIMSLCATLYPAWQATKIEPAQVLGQV